MTTLLQVAHTVFAKSRGYGLLAQLVYPFFTLLPFLQMDAGSYSTQEQIRKEYFCQIQSRFTYSFACNRGRKHTRTNPVFSFSVPILWMDADSYQTQGRRYGETKFGRDSTIGTPVILHADRHTNNHTTKNLVNWGIKVSLRSLDKSSKGWV